MYQFSRRVVVAATITAIAVVVPTVATAAHSVRTTGGTRVYYAVTSDTDTSKTADPTQGIYWMNADGTGSRHRLSSKGASVNQPYGIAINPIRGYVYWANYVGGQISRANLDGTGSGVNLFRTGSAAGPVGIAIDPTHAKLYWSNYTPPGSIQVGALNGQGKPSTLALSGVTHANAPCDLTIDTSSMLLYWANCGLTGDGNTMMQSDLTASNKTSVIALTTSGAYANEVNGIAVNSALNSAYWTSYNAKSADKVLGMTPLALPHGANLNLTGGGKPVAPEGIALDPTTNTLYWANGTVQKTLASGVTSVLSSAAVPANDYVGYMAILAPPRSLGAPVISGSLTVGSTLTCSKGGWDANMPSAHYFDAAATYGYSWTMNGQPVLGAMKSTFTTSIAGRMACAVEASNVAGSTAVSSDAVTVG